MQARRITRTRSSTNNESQDENTVAVGRITRANSTKKDAILTGALQAKQTTTQATKRRAALGDVSNVHKAEGILESKGGKKGGKSVLATKAGSGITKATRTTTRATTIVKEKGSEDLKRANSSTTQGPRTKKRNTSSTSALAASAVKVIEATDVENVVPTTIEIPEPTTTSVTVEIVKTAPVSAPPSSFEVEEPKVKKPKVVAKDEGWTDLDAEDVDDPLMVSEYVNEIFEYLKEKEVETQPNPDYMDHQEELQWKMRGILVDWLIEVHTRFDLLPETLFLTVNIIDRFLSNRVVSLDKLQLVGVTAMFIAAKYEEVFSPVVKNFIYVADGGYTEEEILKAERQILQSLDYNLSYPSPMNFLRRISKADNYNIETRTFAKYLMEVSLLDNRFMEYLPSHVAAASMYMARKIFDRNEWDANFVHYSGFTEEEIQPVFLLLIDYLARPVKHEAIFKKYAARKFKKASILCRRWAKPNAAAYGIDIHSLLDEKSR